MAVHIGDQQVVAVVVEEPLGGLLLRGRVEEMPGELDILDLRDATNLHRVTLAVLLPPRPPCDMKEFIMITSHRGKGRALVTG
jgi:hypothetical protein